MVGTRLDSVCVCVCVCVCVFRLFIGDIVPYIVGLSGCGGGTLVCFYKSVQWNSSIVDTLGTW